jgi:cytochrome c peroxidase
VLILSTMRTRTHIGIISLLVGTYSYSLIVTPTPAPRTTVVELGQTLFGSAALSVDRTASCQSCHDPAHAFADPRPRSIGVGGKTGTRNAPSLIDIASDSNFFWDGRRTKLEDAVVDPLTNPVELGWPSMEDAVQRLQEEPGLSVRFHAAFPNEPAKITSSQVQRALTAFVASLSGGNSVFDRSQASHTSLPRNAEEGRKLFEGIAECSTCHTSTGAPARFSDGAFHHSGIGDATRSDHLPELAQAVARDNLSAGLLGPKVLTDLDWSSLGRFAVSHQPTDIGAFRTPSLRNVAVTAPYMHDGSIPTLDQAVDHEIYYRGFSRGKPINLSLAERQAIVAFLETLTDESGQHSMSNRPKIR